MTNKPSERTKTILYNILYALGALSLLIGMIAHIRYTTWGWIVFAIGCILMATPRLLSFSLPEDMRLRRLHFISALATLLILASAWCMYQFPERNYWALALCLFAAFDLIVRLRYPKNK